MPRVIGLVLPNKAQVAFDLDRRCEMSIIPADNQTVASCGPYDVDAMKARCFRYLFASLAERFGYTRDLALFIVQRAP